VTAILVEKLHLEQLIKQTVEINEKNSEIRSGLMSGLHNALGLRVRGLKLMTFTPDGSLCSKAVRSTLQSLHCADA
jgi:hypothetical protein